MHEKGGPETGGIRLEKRSFKLAILLLLLAAGTLYVASYSYFYRGAKDSGQEEYTLELSGKAWNLMEKPTINVLIIPNPSLPNWRDTYSRDAKQAFEDWIVCTRIFVANYGYNYLSKINFNISVAEAGQLTDSGYDITVSWIEQLSFTEATGATILYTKPTGQVSKAAITLPISITKNSEKYHLSDDDIRNILVDEIGHSLGLEHSSFKGDALHESYDFTQEIICHSSLDIYGLAVAYSYLATGTFKPSSKSIVSLESTGIPYQFMRNGM